MRYLLSLILLCLPITALGQPKCAVDASVKISNSNGGATKTGSGTVVGVYNGKGLVLTAAHVFKDERHGDAFFDGKLTITFPDGKTAIGKFLAWDKYGNDIAAISIDADKATPFVPVATAYDGPDVWHVGYPEGRGPHHHRGTAGTGKDDEGRQAIKMSFAAHPGDSGGGVFRKDGRALIGVLHSTTKQESIGVPQPVTRRFAEVCWRSFIIVQPAPSQLAPPQPIYVNPTPVYVQPSPPAVCQTDPAVIAALARIEAGLMIANAKLDGINNVLVLPPPTVTPGPPTVLPTPPNMLPVPPGVVLPVPPPVARPPAVLPGPPAPMLPVPPASIGPSEVSK